MIMRSQNTWPSTRRENRPGSPASFWHGLPTLNHWIHKNQFTNIQRGTMIHQRFIVLLLGVAASALAFGGTMPQSYLDGTPQSRKDPLVYPVRILAIDGYHAPTTPLRITPGPHWVEVAGPQQKGSPGGATQTVVLKIQPCTYYYLGARKQSALADQWQLVVTEEDTIQSCDPAKELKQFGSGSAAPPPKPRPSSGK